jgi:hypothetical protein
LGLIERLTKFFRTRFSSQKRNRGNRRSAWIDNANKTNNAAVRRPLLAKHPYDDDDDDDDDDADEDAAYDATRYSGLSSRRQLQSSHNKYLSPVRAMSGNRTGKTNVKFANTDNVLRRRTHFSSSSNEVDGRRRQRFGSSLRERSEDEMDDASDSSLSTASSFCSSSGCASSNG